MSTLAINRALKEALGERGSMTFPIMPSLQPVLVVDDLPMLGGAGVPWGLVVTSGAVAGQRSCAFITAPAGSVICLEYSRCSGAAEVADIRILTEAVPFASTATISLCDTRRWGPFDPLAGAAAGSTIQCAGTGAQVAGSQGVLADRVTQTGFLQRPMFIGPGSILWQGTVDNTGIGVIARGRIWFRE